MAKYLTSESVCQGHPDKLCDFISDSILDACITQDPGSRVACEVMATNGKIIVAGEITCKKQVPFRKTINRALTKCGYDPNDFEVSINFGRQSEDIAGGVDKALEVRGTAETELGAGDQGTVFGYATNETKEYMPLPLVLSHKICKKLDDSRKQGIIQGIKSDGKAQVSVEYEDGKPKKISTVVVSVQHEADKKIEELRGEIIKEVLNPVFKDFPMHEDTLILVNPSGRFVIGGPTGDTGLTGRKIIVDTYGGQAAHGGGAFSGKDCTKVDRSGAYMARHIAKHIVAAGLADKCQVAISYAIGKAEPVALDVETFGTEVIPTDTIEKHVRALFPLTPSGIIEYLHLREPIYSKTSCYGHFTDQSLSWERLDFGKINYLRSNGRISDV